jgi:hypothetical protein
MVFRLPLMIEVDKPEAEFCASRQIALKVIYERGRWRAECQNPPIVTVLCETMEEAIRSAAHEVAAEFSHA